jgi:hypothetical protein
MISTSRDRVARFALATVASMALAVFCSALAAHAEASAYDESPAACSQVGYSAQEPGADPRAAPNPGGPTLVGAGVFVTELREIDAVRDDFWFRGYLRATWCDPRLRFKPTAAGVEERVFMAAEAEREINRIWFPAGFPVNRVGQLDISERVLRIRHDGTVHHDLNLSVHLAADYDLRRFPFDRQVLELQIESFRWPRDSLRWVANPASTGFADDFEIPEWRITRVGSRVEQKLAIRNPVAFDHFVFEIEVERESGFYLWKVMLPLFIIVAISWSVFWMTDEPLAGRSRITATGVLTIVAYQFVVAGDLPRIAYLTLLDKVMILSLALLAVTVVQSMIVARYQRDDPVGATRIDRASRWLFPLVYAGLLLAVAVSSGGLL